MLLAKGFWTVLCVFGCNPCQFNVISTGDVDRQKGKYRCIALITKLV